MEAERITDQELYLSVIGQECTGCNSARGATVRFMPDFPAHLGNVVVLCASCQADYRPFPIDMFARVAEQKYEREEALFGRRFPVDPRDELALPRLRREALERHAATVAAPAALVGTGS